MTYSEQRTFGLIFSAIFIIIGLWPLLTAQPISIIWLLLGVMLLLIALLAPQILTPFSSRWIKLSHILGEINNQIILGLIFFLIITPFGLIARLFGHDPLRLRKRNEESFWISRKQGWAKDSFKDQF